jgi:hypothetical protein
LEKFPTSPISKDSQASDTLHIAIASTACYPRAEILQFPSGRDH